MPRNGLLIECVVIGLVGAAALALTGAPLLIPVWAALGAGLYLLKGRAGLAPYAVARGLTPLVFGYAFLAAYQTIHATPSLQVHILQEVSEYSGEQYYAVISTLFALLTALLLVKGMEAFDRLNTVIAEEANKVRSIVEFMYYFEEEDGEALPDVASIKRRTRRIRLLMRHYVEACITDPTALRDRRSTELLRRATQEVGALDCFDENDRIALAEIMRALNELFTVRARRIASSRARIPTYMLVALVIMSLALVTPFYIGAPEAHPYAGMYIFVLTAFCTFVLILLRDINAPFEGFWQVDLRALRSVRADLDAWLAQDQPEEQRRVARAASEPASMTPTRRMRRPSRAH